MPGHMHLLTCPVVCGSYLGIFIEFLKPGISLVTTLRTQIAQLTCIKELTPVRQVLINENMEANKSVLLPSFSCRDSLETYLSLGL